MHCRRCHEIITPFTACRRHPSLWAEWCSRECIEATLVEVSSVGERTLIDVLSLQSARRALDVLAAMEDGA